MPKRKIDWFLLAGLLAIVAMLLAPAVMYELRCGPYATLPCDTDTDCAERFGGSGDPE